MGGGSNKTSVTVPAWLEDAAKSGIARAEDVSRIGYTPYYGPDVAAMTPAQIAAMQGTNQTASAFGMPTVDVTAGMPAATDYNGMSAYSSGGMYDAALAELKARNPAQYAKITSLFGGGAAGSAGSGGSASAPSAAAAARSYDRPEGAGARYAGGGAERGTTSMATIGSYMPGGMNTSNPGSLKNEMAARLTSGKQSAPTASDRPISRSSASGGGSGGMGGGK
jgi:hypothetical protein